MAGYFLLGALASFGLLSALWALLGWLQPGAEGAVLVCLGSPREGILSRYKWLRSLGFLRCPLVAVTAELPPMDSEAYEICTGEALLARLELEREVYDGTGNGDSPGRHQRRGVSEL